MATAIALRDRHLPMCGGIVAISPWADLTCSGESMISRAEVDIEMHPRRFARYGQHLSARC